ncbi:hypothetical protein P691DRAFT_684256 [Macrolepiota fuliginosa MF-IS2]|uniref:2OGFeDO JBP1/TET oxygenase domain-containing protein n=1 Tax=Macrolepiota fuliginosa MF-IS2 TaxID=1400762 RepID=A0A9P6BX31_9AGAR|nr:hypothetical protein P691DRAFT_684256 [Macrolepiota fuliginosa MF-IS2]
MVIFFISSINLSIVQLNLDITKIRDRTQFIKETKNIVLGHFDKPATIVDSSGHILVWYLPQVLTKQQQDQLVTNTKPLIPKLTKSLQPGKKQSWHNNPKLFVTTLEGQELAPGVETFTVGWYQQGHAVSFYNIIYLFQLKITAIVRPWLGNTRSISSFLNLILSFTHPDLYLAALKSLTQFQMLPATAQYAQIWPIVFHGISVISNQITPEHIDYNGSWAWYDQLLTIGNYSQAIFTLKDLKLSLDYKPGTVIHFCGNLLTHEVGSWDHGDHICYAYLVKKSIFDGLHIKSPGWSYLKEVKKAVMESDIKYYK